MKVRILKCPTCGSENVRRARIGDEQREARNTYKCLDCRRFFYYNPKKPKRQVKPKQEHEEDLSVEDSEGDGLMLFDDPMFPPDEDD